MFIFPYKIGFSPLFYPFTFLPFYLYHMSSAVFPRQPSVLVMFILLDGNEYREGKDYGQQEDNDAAAQIIALHLRPHIQYLGSMVAGIMNHGASGYYAAVWIHDRVEMGIPAFLAKEVGQIYRFGISLSIAHSF